MRMQNLIAANPLYLLHLVSKENPDGQKDNQSQDTRPSKRSPGLNTAVHVARASKDTRRQGRDLGASGTSSRSGRDRGGNGLVVLLGELGRAVASIAVGVASVVGLRAHLDTLLDVGHTFKVWDRVRVFYRERRRFIG